MSMRVKKAIFPVGGLGTRFLPATKAMPKEMLPIVDKPLIQYAVEEALEAGCEELIFVTGRGKAAIEDHFDHSFELESVLKDHHRFHSLKTIQSLLQVPGKIAYVRQQEPAGLGHAIWCARHLVHNEPVAVLLADDLIDHQPGCLKQMIDRYESGNMMAIMEVDPQETGSYGIIKPSSEYDLSSSLVKIEGLVEKPLPTQAPSKLAIVGRYIIEPGVFDELSLHTKGAGGEIQLTDSLARRIPHTPCLGFKFEGRRFDCGSKIGFLQANLTYALQRPDLKDPLNKWIKTL